MSKNLLLSLTAISMTCLMFCINVHWFAIPALLISSKIWKVNLTQNINDKRLTFGYGLVAEALRSLKNLLSVTDTRMMQKMFLKWEHAGSGDELP